MHRFRTIAIAVSLACLGVQAAIAGPYVPSIGTSESTGVLGNTEATTSVAPSLSGGPESGAPAGIPGKVPPVKNAKKMAYLPTPSTSTNTPAVPTVRQPNVVATGTDGSVVPHRESSTEIWEKAIKAPPEGVISKRSKHAAEIALMQAYQSGRMQNLPPIAGTNGEVLYAYGQSLPTLVTAPLHTSLIVLQAGMKPNKGIGLSPAFWQVNTLMAGDQPEVAITPRFAGLHGDLVISGTSASGKAMNYVIEVVSDANRYTPMIGFYYPDAIEHTWKEDQAASQSFHKKVDAETVAPLPSIDAADLDFRWKMHCAGGGWFSNSDCKSIMPERVFDDGKQTFIQFKPGQGSQGGIPSILAENAAGQNAIINTQFRDGYYIVDGVPPKILLIAGKGDSGKVVKLVHEGK